MGHLQRVKVHFFGSLHQQRQYRRRSWFTSLSKCETEKSTRILQLPDRQLAVSLGTAWAVGWTSQSIQQNRENTRMSVKVGMSGCLRRNGVCSQEWDLFSWNIGWIRRWDGHGVGLIPCHLPRALLCFKHVSVLCQVYSSWIPSVSSKGHTYPLHACPSSVASVARAGLGPWRCPQIHFLSVRF